MRFVVRHQTVYRYSGPVRLAEHRLRFHPRPDAGILRTRRLDIDPTPLEREDALDAFGNWVTRVRFDGACDHLAIDSGFELDTASATAAGGSESIRLPWPADATDASSIFLACESTDAVRAFAADLAESCGGSAFALLDRLNEVIFKTIRHDIRAEGAARRPEQTLALGHGACRDVTILFIAACRSLGIPARFVSGYQAEADTPDGRRHLHAWPEAFIPGEGWRAYDPTHGLAVGEGHVALAAAPEQAGTMPLEGGYFGDAVTSTLAYRVEIETR